MFARFDENPAMTLQDIKETKCYRRTDGQRENSIPTTNKFCRGYKNKFCGGGGGGGGGGGINTEMHSGPYNKGQQVCIKRIKHSFACINMCQARV